MAPTFTERLGKGWEDMKHGFDERRKQISAKLDEWDKEAEENRKKLAEELKQKVKGAKQATGQAAAQVGAKGRGALGKAASFTADKTVGAAGSVSEVLVKAAAIGFGLGGVITGAPLVGAAGAAALYAGGHKFGNLVRGLRGQGPGPITGTERALTGFAVGGLGLALVAGIVGSFRFATDFFTNRIWDLHDLLARSEFGKFLER